jgi:hypothetical protein
MRLLNDVPINTRPDVPIGNDVGLECRLELMADTEGVGD